MSQMGTLFTQKFQLGTHDKINTDTNMCFDIHYELVRE